MSTPIGLERFVGHNQLQYDVEVNLGTPRRGACGRLHPGVAFGLVNYHPGHEHRGFNQEEFLRAALFVTCYMGDIINPHTTVSQTVGQHYPGLQIGLIVL